MPSARLEQEAHILGFREKELPPNDIGSPQQMQILGFIRVWLEGSRRK
jgi:hypothetical protein